MDTSKPLADKESEVKTPDVQPAVASSKPPKSKKKVVILVLVLGVLFLCCLVSIIVFYSVLWPKFRDPNDCNYVLTGDTFKAAHCSEINPTVTATPVPTPIVVTDNVTGISVRFLSQPVSIPAVTLYTNQGALEPPVSYYRTGTFTHGTLTNTTKHTTLDLTGLDLYLAATDNVSMDMAPYGPYYSENRFTLKDGTYYLLDDVSGLEDVVKVAPHVSLDYAMVPWDTFAKLVNPMQPLIHPDADYTAFLTTAKGLSIDFNGMWEYLIPADSIPLTQADYVKGIPIYTSTGPDADKTLIKSNDGFLYQVMYKPSLVTPGGNGKEIPQVTWNGGHINELSYAYESIGTCAANFLEVESNPPALMQTGYDQKGNPVYEATDKNEAYRASLYNQDYIQGEIYKINSMTQDDTTPFTFAQYLTYHPVFYWRDEYNRLIKFAADDFTFVGGCGKPAVYIYPTQTTKLSLQVVPNGSLTLTVPQIGKDNTWQVSVAPSGQVTDPVTAKTYDYLWWESHGVIGLRLPNQGFVMAATDLAASLKDKLSAIGLNATEQQAFLTYWLPRMQNVGAPYYYVTFLFNTQVDLIAKLKFTPQPDHVNRVFMLYQPLTQPKTVTPLQLPRLDRTGFYVVEWGGAKF